MADDKAGRQVDQEDALDRTLGAVTQMDFATEVRADRLLLLWRVTFWAGMGCLWLAYLRRNLNGDVIAAIAVSLMVGALLAGRLLRRGWFTSAVWSLVGAGMLALVFPMLTGNTNAVDIAPFVFPLLIFTIGLLLPPAHTFITLTLATVLTFAVPYAATDSMAFVGAHQIIALLIAFLSALLAAQTTGEMYQITGWALENFQKERRTTNDLFENRQRLEKALRRSEVLGETLKDINDQLETAKHFRGQFLANMSHELRTPLNAIIGFSETMLTYPMMYDDVYLPEAYRHDLRQIHTSGQQLLTVVNDILDLSKVDAGKLEVNIERVKLDPLIDNVMMTAAGLVGNKAVELKRALPPRLPDVLADETRLRQVLLNLYSNAVKFTEQGSITIAVRDEDDEVYISVSDTGAGIKPEALEKIFEEFSQVESYGRDPRSGAGLGLTISRKLLNLMHGRIWVESEYGDGATFYVVVPKYGAPVPQAAPAAVDENTIIEGVL